MFRGHIVAIVTAVLVAVASLAAPAHAQVDPNYTFRSDVGSKLMAGKPFAPYVLHRVPGSLHDAPRTPVASNEALRRGKSLYGPSTPLYVGKGDEERMCTAAVAGYGARGNKYAITAGHCGKVGDPVVSADSWQLGPSGTVVKVNEELDYALIELGSNAEVTRSYDGVTINHLGAKPMKTGETVCKRGVASATTCGMVLGDGGTVQTNHVCAMKGDSGAPLYARDRLVGMVNGGLWPAPFDVACSTPLQGPVHQPTLSTRMDSVLSDLNNGFRLP